MSEFVLQSFWYLDQFSRICLWTLKKIMVWGANCKSHVGIITHKSSYCFHRVLAIAILSVRLSVSLSHGWINQKRCKLGSLNLHHRLPGRLEDSSFRNRKAFPWIRRGSPLTTVLNERGVGEICDFGPIRRCILVINSNLGPISNRY